MHDLRVLIVDDEPLARDCVRLALAGESEVCVVGECGDGPSAVAAIRDLRPDLVYLDIQMPGSGGFSVIEDVGTAAMPAVIFVTAYQDHALRAFTVHALDYLLKPFSDERFRESLRHARARLGADPPSVAQALQGLLVELGRRRPPRWLTVPEQDEGGRRLIPIDDIDWLSAEGNYVHVQVGSVGHLVRATLQALLQELDPARFVRIHRSIVVQLDRIERVVPWASGDYMALLRDGRQLRISRHYRDALLRLFL